MEELTEYRDRLPVTSVRGRGAGLNPGNRFEGGGTGIGDGGPSLRRLHVLGDYLDEVLAENPDGTRIATKVYRDRTRSVINPVQSPDLCMKWTVNPYRGCEHGCIYCYARPGHEYLGLSSGLDFETKIIAKFDAPELLREELIKPSWRGEAIMFSGVTDPYQPVEAKLGLSRRVMEVFAELAQPIGVITKNKLITRDLDLIATLHEHSAVGAAVSITSLDNKLAAKMEPRASSPSDRLEAVRQLAALGVPVTVMTAPIVPGLNDSEIPAILEAAKEAGATSAGWVLLRLPHQIKAIFLEWVQRHFPDRAAKVENAIRETRDGELYNSDFYSRQRGSGPRAASIKQTFDVFAKRHGLVGKRADGPLSSDEFLRRQAAANAKGQGLLFG